jgi:adenine phosphoribosyltransferase
VLSQPPVGHDARMVLSSSSSPPPDAALRADLAAAIRTIPDYPKPGILFRDITTLLADATAFRRSIDALAAPFQADAVAERPRFVAGMEARGFILGGALAYALGVGFVPVRKKGKLPYKTVKLSYQLEYGEDEMEIHEDAVGPGDRVLFVDDLIATGGTALGACALLTELGATLVGASFVIDLPDLGGADALRAKGIPVHALVPFAGH